MNDFHVIPNSKPESNPTAHCGATSCSLSVRSRTSNLRNSPLKPKGPIIDAALLSKDSQCLHTCPDKSVCKHLCCMRSKPLVVRLINKRRQTHETSESEELSSEDEYWHSETPSMKRRRIDKPSIFSSEIDFDFNINSIMNSRSTMVLQTKYLQSVSSSQAEFAFSSCINVSHTTEDISMFSYKHPSSDPQSEDTSLDSVFTSGHSIK